MKNFIIVIIVFLIITLILYVFTGLEFWVCLLINIGGIGLLIDLLFLGSMVRSKSINSDLEEWLQYVSIIISSSQKYSKDFDSFFNSVASMSVIQAAEYLNLPTKAELSGTIFYHFFSCFYKDNRSLCVLKIIEISWGEEDAITHPLTQWMYEKYKLEDTRSEEILTKYPWLLPL